MKPTHLVLDFDGTCTQIPKIHQPYLNQVYARLAAHLGGLDAEEWNGAIAIVRKASPKAGWMLSGCPAAPAAADPYILAYEAARYICRQRGAKESDLPDLNHDAYAANPAPWRKEAKSVLTKLVNLGVKVVFISNSGTQMIMGRLKELQVSGIDVQSDASKFRICEPAWDGPLSPRSRKVFESIPAQSKVTAKTNPGRPVYLRRGRYFEAIDRALDGDLKNLKTTVFCGDIWEMDLAMPYALGASVHLITREKPFPTYPFEKNSVARYGRRGKVSKDLNGLLQWF